MAAWFVASLVPFVDAQKLEPGERFCGDCKTTGRIAHEHLPEVLEQEKDVLFCSFWMDNDPEALCLDWVPCPNCQNPRIQGEAKREFDQEVERRRAWRKARRDEVDQYTRTEVVHIETEHFIISWDRPEIKIGRRRIRLHDAAHLYAQRAEELYRYIMDWHGIEPQHMMRLCKVKLNLLESLRAARTLAPYMTDLSLQSDSKIQLIGPLKSNLVMWADPEKTRTEEDFHQYLCHVVAHHIYHDIQHGQYTFWMFKQYGWMYEGTAFVIETRLFGVPRTTCSQESGGFANYRNTPWEALVKKLVLSGKCPTVQDVIAKGADTLTDEERWLAWSYVDYLTWLDPKKLPLLVSKMTGEQVPTRDALRDVYGLTVGQFVDGWTEFVRKEYSLRPLKGPFERPAKGEAPKGS